MNKIKVFALFRNNASYIDPLLEEFNNDPQIDLFAAFSVNKPGSKAHLENVKHVFLSESDKEMYYEKNDYKLFQKDVIEHADSFKPDAILLATSYYSPTTWMLIRYARKNNIPIVTRMTVESSRKRNLAVKTIKKIIVGKYCRSVDSGVYECENQKKYMIEYGMKEKSLFFAPCAVDNDYFHSLKNKYDTTVLKEKYNIKQDDNVIVFTGQLIDRKRPMDILYAYKILKKQNIRMKIFFLGAGYLSDTMQVYIRDNQMEDDVFMPGKLNAEEMSKYLTIADIYVLPSENDASPKALNEAMNFELPIIITKGVDTAKEMCINGLNGYIVDTGNYESIAESISLILRNNVDNQMGIKSYEIVSKYSYARVIESWIKAIQYSIQNKNIGNH